MSTAVRLSLAQYDRMIESGVFDEDPDRRIELINGELREMNPIGLTHDETVTLLTDWTIACNIHDRIRLRVQQSIGISLRKSAPQPDVVWVAKKSYKKSRPMGDDILLVIEVAESSLSFDRGEKAQLYAAAGLADYWIVNLVDCCIEVYRQPELGTYRDVTKFSVGQEVRPVRFPAWH